MCGSLFDAGNCLRRITGEDGIVVLAPREAIALDLSDAESSSSYLLLLVDVVERPEVKVVVENMIEIRQPCWCHQARMNKIIDCDILMILLPGVAVFDDAAIILLSL
jgi:hypothetical protein